MTFSAVVIYLWWLSSLPHSFLYSTDCMWIQIYIRSREDMWKFHSIPMVTCHMKASRHTFQKLQFWGIHQHTKAPDIPWSCHCREQPWKFRRINDFSSLSAASPHTHFLVRTRKTNSSKPGIGKMVLEITSWAKTWSRIGLAQDT